MTFQILAREVYEPPAKGRKKASTSYQPSAHAEAALVRQAAGWTVLWKASAMSAVAFSSYPRLLEAWRSYREHRAYVRRMAQPYVPPTRREELERQLAALHQELEALP